jgi:hypothetical protein
MESLLSRQQSGSLAHGRVLAYLTTTGIDSHDVWIVATTERHGVLEGSLQPRMRWTVKRLRGHQRALPRILRGESRRERTPTSYAGLTVVIRPIGATGLHSCRE